MKLIRAPLGFKKAIWGALSIFIFLCLSCASRPRGLSAEEYYDLGRAYQNLKKYEEAKKWYKYSLSYEKTMAATRYQLGLIAWEEKKFQEALDYFLLVLPLDPDNTMVLKSAAFVALYLKNYDLAESLYNRYREQVPETPEEAYNHAIVLTQLSRFYEAQEALAVYLEDKKAEGDSLLLQARIEAGLSDPRCIDSYAAWIGANSNQLGIKYEYIKALEKHEFYAKAIEELNSLIASDKLSSFNLDKPSLVFKKAEILALAEDEQAATVLEEAIELGYQDIQAIDELKKTLGK